MNNTCPICGKEILGSGVYWESKIIRDGETIYERCVHGAEKIHKDYYAINSPNQGKGER